MVSRTAEHHVRMPLLRSSWETMTFVHWAVPPERIQPLLPRGLTVDVYDGAAWVGLLPFLMADIRPLAVPLGGGHSGHRNRSQARSSTPGTNLRTYVRGPDGHTGLWFFDLYLGTGLLATGIRVAVGAPYHKGSHLTVEHRGDTVIYGGVGVGTGTAYRLEVRVGPQIVPSDLDIWLTSRWRSYTRHLGAILTTPVEHEPWQLRECAVAELEQNLTDAAGLGEMSAPSHVRFSDGVRGVRLGPPALALKRRTA